MISIFWKPAHPVFRDLEHDTLKSVLQQPFQPSYHSNTAREYVVVLLKVMSDLYVRVSLVECVF